MRLAAPSWGLNVVEVVQEVMSGATDLDKRPEVQAYYARAQATPGQAFIFPRVDRLGRLAELIITIARRLIRLKARVYVVGFRQALDEDGPEWLTFQFQSLIAEQNYLGLRVNLAKGKFQKASEGRWPQGRHPYGYRMSRDGRGRAVLPEPDPDHRLVYDRIVEACEAGIGAQTTAATLSREGMPPPRSGQGWSAKTVLSILKNPAYLGRLVYTGPEGERATVTYPALITPTRWQALQVLITTRKTQRSPRTKFPALFGGRATCALCGGAMTIQTYRGRAGQMRDYGQYHCRNRSLRLHDGRGVTPCEHVRYHRVGEIDEAGWQALVQTLTDPLLLRRALEARAATPPEHHQRIAELKAQMASAVARTLALDLPDGVLESAIRPLKAELARLEAQQRQPLTPDVRVDAEALAAQYAGQLSGRDDLESRKQAVLNWNVRLRLNPEGVADLLLDVLPG